MREGRLWIDGRLLETGTWESGIDPRTGVVAYRYAVAGRNDVETAVASARRAQPAWAATPWSVRRRVLQRTMHIIVERMDAILQTVMLETGKPPLESLSGAEIANALECLAYYANETPPILRPRGIRTYFRPFLFGKFGEVRRVPLGVIGTIIPWNVPFSLAAAAVAPALAAGDTVVVKPSEYAPLSVLELAQAFAAAGLPPGVLNVVPGGPEAGRALVEADIDRIVFIGSVGTGRAIARALAERGRRPPLLELGGKDAMIVCADADPRYAAQGAVWNAFWFAGQACASVERVYVVRAVARAFVEEVLQATERLTTEVGFLKRNGQITAPTNNWTFGPLIRDAARHKVHAQVTDAVSHGARLLAGGRIPEGSGFWYPPTVLTDVTEDMLVVREETFGPVLPIAVVADEEEAIARANASPFDLTASVWTRDLVRGRQLAARLQAGLVMVNDHASAYTMIDCPWGGSRGSGYGRLHGPDALRELTEARAYVMDRVLRPKQWWYPYAQAVYDYFHSGAEVLFAGSFGRRVVALRRVGRAVLAARRQQIRSDQGK
jgi:succinate-semialdehyde dehydrogenase/glutarate-semialdehyde dehydrogenase